MDRHTPRPAGSGGGWGSPARPGGGILPLIWNLWRAVDCARRRTSGARSFLLPPYRTGKGRGQIRQTAPPRGGAVSSGPYAGFTSLAARREGGEDALAHLPAQVSAALANRGTSFFSPQVRPSGRPLTTGRAGSKIWASRQMGAAVTHATQWLGASKAAPPRGDGQIGSVWGKRTCVGRPPPSSIRYGRQGGRGTKSRSRHGISSQQRGFPSAEPSRGAC